jgi:hypothetical protein
MKRSFQEGIRIEGFGEQGFEGLVFEPLFEDLAFKELHRILSDPEWRLGEGCEHFLSVISLFPGASDSDKFVNNQIELFVVFVVGGWLCGELSGEVFEERFEVILGGEVGLELEG